MPMKTKKTKKSKRQRGNTTYGHGARKKWKGSGHHGGVGMAGTGKRADHKKSLIIKLYGNKYFGKQGITSRSTEKKENLVMNLGDIQNNLDSLMKKYGKTSSLSKDNEKKGKELILKDFKILGDGELKEKTQELIIQKLHAYIVKNLGEISGGLENIQNAGSVISGNKNITNSSG